MENLTKETYTKEEVTGMMTAFGVSIALQPDANIPEKAKQYIFDYDKVCAALSNKTASGSVAAPKEHIYTDKEIIGLAEKEIESLRQQLKERDELIVNLKQDIVRLIEDVNKAYDH